MEEISMEDIEEIWEQCFSQHGRDFAEARPDYQVMEHTERMIAALYWLELEMYNGGFIQFFCNWGYDAYLLAVEGLEAIGASETRQLLLDAYAVIAKFEDDDRMEELWDLPKYLSQTDDEELTGIDEEYWEDKEHIMQLMLRNFSLDKVGG